MPSPDFSIYGESLFESSRSSGITRASSFSEPLSPSLYEEQQVRSVILSISPRPCMREPLTSMCSPSLPPLSPSAKLKHLLNSPTFPTGVPALDQQLWPVSFAEKEGAIKSGTLLQSITDMANNCSASSPFHWNKSPDPPPPLSLPVPSLALPSPSFELPSNVNSLVQHLSSSIASQSMLRIAESEPSVSRICVLAIPPTPQHGFDSEFFSEAVLPEREETYSCPSFVPNYRESPVLSKSPRLSFLSDSFEEHLSHISSTVSTRFSSTSSVPSPSRVLGASKAAAAIGRQLGKGLSLLPSFRKFTSQPGSYMCPGESNSSNGSRLSAEDMLTSDHEPPLSGMSMVRWCRDSGFLRRATDVAVLLAVIEVQPESRWQCSRDLSRSDSTQIRDARETLLQAYRYHLAGFVVYPLVMPMENSSHHRSSSTRLGLYLCQAAQILNADCLVLGSSRSSHKRLGKTVSRGGVTEVVKSWAHSRVIVAGQWQKPDKKLDEVKVEADSFLSG